VRSVWKDALCIPVAELDIFINRGPRVAIDVERESNFIGDSTNVEAATGKNDEV